MYFFIYSKAASNSVNHTSATSQTISAPSSSTSTSEPPAAAASYSVVSDSVDLKHSKKSRHNHKKLSARNNARDDDRRHVGNAYDSLGEVWTISQSVSASSQPTPAAVADGIYESIDDVPCFYALKSKKQKPVAQNNGFHLH